MVHKWGNEENYNDEVQGRVLSQTEVEEYVKEYLDRNHLSNTITYSFSSSYMARTSVFQNTLRIRTPVQYREHGIQSVLDHEIGTHVFRRLNDKKQPWHRRAKAFDFSPYLATEEGLAVIHAQLSLDDRLLFFPALNYYAVCRAEYLSFSELFAELKDYLPDKQKRFNICLKVKRGLTDTSVPGAFTKNQIYLAGAIQVCQWLVKNDYAVEKLYVGKVALNDISRAWSQSELTVSDLLLPAFLNERTTYKETVLDIIKTNKLPVRLSAT
ncbi:flavohemoglobin expression-modulating QEGLA motif protein [Candidatus Woesebacteria bacterium]|nr:flavohemoglobin expression-modulating QEGLA motif protein [Candidatus Woesebacteria bacterium]